jgi:tRNA(Leu) C34 or U34 (ribose-2'-O)-methylase TrmL
VRTQGPAAGDPVTEGNPGTGGDPSTGGQEMSTGGDPSTGGQEMSTGGDEFSVGVGPWVGPWPDDPRYDAGLLAGGDRRNVVDAYRYWTVEAIRADLDGRRHPFQVAVENWSHDLNIGSVVRTANAFNAAGVHVVGRRRWNRRGAMVTDRYLHVHHHPDVAALAGWAAAEGLPLLGVDNLPGAVPLEGFALPLRCVLLFGQEGPGLSDAARSACSAVLSIAQYGSTRSINAGAAAAIAMHAWIRTHAAGPATPHARVDTSGETPWRGGS